MVENRGGSWLLVALALVAPSARADTRDQVNEPTWTGGAVNIIPANKVSQTFVPSMPLLTRIEVALKTGNAQPGGDQITLTLLGADGARLGTSTQHVKEGFDGFLQFVIPNGGQVVTPGAPLTIQLADTGKVVFWWKYAAGNPYAAGKAYFYGAAFQDNDFLFRTYGASVAPGIALTISPDPVTLSRGGTRTATVGVTRTGGAGAATIVFTGLPQGVSVSPATRTTSGSSASFTFSASAAAQAGTYAASVAGAAGPAHASKGFQIKVSAPPPPTCPQGQTSCAGQCVDTSANAQHCGSCGHACGAGQQCSGGQCLSLCGGAVCGAGKYCCQKACRDSGVGVCAYQGSSAEYYCPADTHSCPGTAVGGNNRCCCGNYDGKVRSCPGPG